MCYIIDCAHPHVRLQLDFDVDVRVNVFEVNIRLLGGLLSGHLLASDLVTGPRLVPAGYDGALLTLANELGSRLLPAFRRSPTGARASVWTWRVPRLCGQP